MPIVELPSTLTFYATDCASCGIPYAIDLRFVERRRDDGDSWYCPNGHSQVFGESDTVRERQRAERAEQELRVARAQRDAAREAKELARAEASHERRVAAGHKAWSTRLKRRIVAGVCPWCNRTFADARMTRHIRTKHPDHAEILD